MLDPLVLKSDEITSLIIPSHLKGERLDVALSLLLPHYSRSRLSGWIQQQQVLVNNQFAKPKTKLVGGEVIALKPLMIPENAPQIPEPILINIAHEDASLIVVNKPAGLVVYPAAGNWSGTLLNGLLYHYPELSFLPRAGIVHRLDKDTTGLMVVARTLSAYTELVHQMQARTIKRIYRAIVQGQIYQDQTINKPIGRDPHNRLRMAVLQKGGKSATTYVHVLKRYTKHSYIQCQLETGRTHQIRVHLRSISHPIVGDAVYGVRHLYRTPLPDAIKTFKRQALHAHILSLSHPNTKQTMTWKALLPQDMKMLLEALANGSPTDSTDIA